MILKDKSILIVSPEPWDHLFVSKHHYAVHLAQRGNKVFFLNPPGRELSVKATEHEDLQVLNYFGFIKGLRFFPKWLRKAFFRKSWEQLQAISKTKFDVIWSFDNSVFYDFDALPKEVLKISHIVDLNQDFETERAAITADFCFCTTEQIKKRLQVYNPKTHKINHGYNHRIGEVKPAGLPGRNSKKAFYAGNLAMQYLDWEIIAEAAKKLTHLDFVFVGSGGLDFDEKGNVKHGFKREVFGLPNVYRLEKVDSSQLPALYQAADVLLIAYQQAHHADQANPHKMMEYLGSGRTVVCTYTGEFENQRALVAMSMDNSEWPTLLAEVIHNLESWNAEDLIRKRKALAMENTYDRQLERVEALLG